MIPDLGKYALSVGWSYGAFLLIIGGLILWTLHQRKVLRRALKEVESRMGRNDG